MLNCDDAWELFLCNETITNNNSSSKNIIQSNINDIPKCSDLYISTTTKISYLSEKINLFTCFWQIPVMLYNTLDEGVIKKQIKITLSSPSEAESLNMHLSKCKFHSVQQITYVNNVDKKIYKDVRKINVGVCDKDVRSMRSKKKSAFYNCFVLIIRIRCPNTSTHTKPVFKEAHIKVFNTGKLELPGIKDKHSHIYILNLLIRLFRTHCHMHNLSYRNEHETVLINSNFTCGYCLDREKFAHILQKKYNIETTYDPCSYPGIMSKIPLQTPGLKVSFMVFRTGSVLIVGKCSEEEIYSLYNDLCKKFRDEYEKIHTGVSEHTGTLGQRPKSKNATRKKYILLGDLKVAEPKGGAV